MPTLSPAHRALFLWRHASTDPPLDASEQIIAMSDEVLDPSAFCAPAVLLSGTVDYSMYNSFRERLGRAPAHGLVVVELSTLGGDPEVARMMGEETVISPNAATRRAPGPAHAVSTKLTIRRHVFVFGLPMPVETMISIGGHLSFMAAARFRPAFSVRAPSRPRRSINSRSSDYFLPTDVARWHL